MMNEEVRRDVGVVQMRDKLQESRLRWYGHVRRCEDDEMIRWAADREEEEEEGKRPRGKPRQRWKDCIKKDGRSIDLELCGDRARWKAATRRPDPPLGNNRFFIVMMFVARRAIPLTIS